MQIQRLHKNIYKLYAYSRTQECLEAYRKKIRIPCPEMEKTQGSEGQEIVRMSWASIFCAQKILKDLTKGIAPPSKAPK